MDISRRLAILVFCGVPVIIGGGIIYAVFGNYVPVFAWAAAVLLLAGGLVSR